MGEQEGKPRWMGKPYGFRISVQTSGEQYCDATWGLFKYHDIAPPADQKRIEQMLVNGDDGNRILICAVANAKRKAFR